MEWLLFPAATDDSLRNLKAGKKKERGRERERERERESHEN